MGATVQKLEAPVISCDGCSLPMNVSCDVPEDQVGGGGSHMGAPREALGSRGDTFLSQVNWP